MKKKPHTAVQLVKGLKTDLDPVFLADQNSPNLRNIRFDQGKIRKGVGFNSCNFTAPNLDWPSNVTAPQYIWEFANNYDNSGNGANGNLSANGTGSNFANDWVGRANHALVLNGSGYASATNIVPGLNDLGANFSFLFEFTTGPDVANTMALGGVWKVDLTPPRSWIIFINSAIIKYGIGDGANSFFGDLVSNIVANTFYQAIISFSNGVITTYLNSTTPIVCSNSYNTPANNANEVFELGSVEGGTYKFTGTIHRAAVLKGTGWNSTDATLLQSYVAPSNYIINIHGYNTYLGSENTLFSTNKWLYRKVSTTELEVKNVEIAFTGNESDTFHTCPIYDASGNQWLIITNGVDPIKKWNGTSSNIANLAGLTNITAKLVLPWKSRLFLFDLTDTGYRVPTRAQWSVVGDMEDYSGTGSGFAELVDTSDWIKAACIYKDRCVVFKQNSIWELTYVGGSTVVVPKLLLENTGALCSCGVIPLDDYIIFFGTQGIYLYDLYSLTSISKDIDYLLYEPSQRIVNFQAIERTRAVYVDVLKEFRIVLPTVGTTPDLYLRYNFLTKGWTRRDLEITAIGEYNNPTKLRWMDLTNTWANATKQWVTTPLIQGAPITLFGKANGTIVEDTRLATNTDLMVYESKDFLFSHAHRVTEVRLEAKGGQFTVYYSLDGGVTWLGERTFAGSSAFKEWVFPINKTTQLLRIMIKSTATTFECRWIEPWYIERARSLNLQY